MTMSIRTLFAVGLCAATSPSLAATRTWDGGGGNALFSSATNWNPDGAPANGDDLVFSSTAPATITNDLTGRTFGSISISRGMTLGGNAFTITGGISSTPSVLGAAVTITPGVTLGASQTFTSGGGSLSSLTFAGSVIFGPHTLTLTGSRPVTFQGVTGSGTAGSQLVKNSTGLLRFDTSAIAVITQPFTLSAGTLDVDGIFQTAVNMTGGTLTGEGTFSGNLDASDGDIVPDDGGLTISGSTVLRGSVNLRVALLGPSDESRLSCGGPVTIQNRATLQVINPAYTPIRGDGFLVLQKSPAGAITGTFSGLAESAEISAGSSVVRLSYLGGNGNDAFLTTVSTTRTWDGGAILNDNWDDPDNWTGNIAPLFGDVLEFPAGIDGTDRGLDNNFPNDTTFRRLVFNGTDYTVRGNRFQLSHGLTVPSGVQTNLDKDIVLARDQTFELGGFLHLDALDHIDTNGHILTFNGGGTINGDIAGSGGVTITAASTVTFEEKTTYTGITRIDPDGTLELFALQVGPGGASLGSAAGETQIHGTLIFGNGRPNDPMRSEENLRLFDGGKVILDDEFGHILGNESSVHLSGDIILDGQASHAMRIETSGGRHEVNGIISGAGSLEVDVNINFNDEFLAFSGPGSNTFTGPVTVTGGPLLLNKSNSGVLAVSSSSLIITGPDSTVETRQDEQIANNCHVRINGGLLRIGNTINRTETIDSLTMDGGGLDGPGGTLHVSGNITAQGSSPSVNLILSVSATPCILNVAQGSTFFILPNAGELSRTGSGRIRKTGLGSVQLTAPVTVPFELVAGQTTFIGNGSGSPVTLNGGALSGTGSCGSVTASAGGGSIGAGTSGVNTSVFTTGSLVLNATTTVQTGVSAPNPGTGFDQLLVTGTVSLGGATLEMQYGPTLSVAVGQSIFPLLNDGTDAIAGTFAGLPQGAFIPIPAAQGGGGWIISYTGGTGNDVVMTRTTTPPVNVAPAVTNVTFGTPDQNGNRTVTIAGLGTPGASYRLENSVNLATWTPEGTAQTAAAGTGALSFTSSASPPVRTKQFWRFRRL
jgi:hypothetical protein